MKVALLTTHLNIGGITSYTVTLAKALKAKGIDDVVVSGGGVLVPELAEAGVSHIKLDILTKKEFGIKVFKAVFELAKLIKRLDIDIIHSHTRVTNVIGFFVSKLCNKPLVTTCHGFFDKNIGRAVLPAWGDRVIAISEAVQRHLAEYFNVDENKISLVYNGIDVKKFLRDINESSKNDLKVKFGIRKDSFILGTVARFTPDKGHDVLLYALYDILKLKSNVQLVFVGEGKERFKVLDLVHRLGLSEHVIFVKEQLDTVNVLAVMDVFMFTPKRKEGLGLALLEAMASGKPVVATKVGGVPSAVLDGVNGFLVRPSDPKALVPPVLSLLNDKGLYKKMSNACRETIVQKFSVNGMVDKVIEIYKEVM